MPEEIPIKLLNSEQGRYGEVMHPDELENKKAHFTAQLKTTTSATGRLLLKRKITELEEAIEERLTPAIFSKLWPKLKHPYQ